MFDYRNNEDAGDLTMMGAADASATFGLTIICEHCDQEHCADAWASDIKHGILECAGCGVEIDVDENTHRNGDL